jgi:hypothetical protein
VLRTTKIAEEKIRFRKNPTRTEGLACARTVKPIKTLISKMRACCEKMDACFETTKIAEEKIRSGKKLALKIYLACTLCEIH